MSLIELLGQVSGVLSFVGALALVLIFGRPLISWLKNLRGMKWSAREDTPDTHLAKAGTPSMGGISIIGAAAFTFISLFILNFALASFNRIDLLGPWPFSALIALVPLFTIGNMALGLIDDWSKARGRGGLRARDKFIGQVVLTFAFLGLALVVLHVVNQASSRFAIDNVVADFAALTRHHVAIMVLLFLFLAIVIIGTCNAVNLTDGIDGLAAGLCVQVGLAFAVLGLFSNAWWLCLAGACAGFLAFNKFPARVFMGDTGSLALGAALGAAAVLSRAVWLLPFIGFIFYVELLSVTFQVLWFKYTRKTTGEGKRLFRRAPLHHHFELGGWSEWRVVATFWAINLITSLIGIILWQSGILPRFP